MEELPRDVRSGQLDEALLRSLTRYLSSLSLTVRVMDGGTVRKMQEVGEKLAEAPEDSSAGGMYSVWKHLVFYSTMNNTNFDFFESP